MAIFCFRRVSLLVIFLMISAFCSTSYASVVMGGTRIIYHSGDKSADVNLKNKSNFPYVVQVWFDDGNMAIRPSDKTNIPFFATPSVFKIAPNDEQIVRVTYTQSQQLPQDRESLFYFNFLEIPPLNVDGTKSATKNKMLITLRNRVKLFYRPDNLGSPNNLFDILQVKRMTNSKTLKVEIKNPSPFYISLSQLEFVNKNNIIKTITKTDMIAPFSSEIFTFDHVAVNENGKIKLTIINDQGARLSDYY